MAVLKVMVGIVGMAIVLIGFIGTMMIAGMMLALIGTFVVGLV